jgi:RimJ/RimL family protein N-acetyltransferase
MSLPPRAPLEIRRLTRADAAEYHAFRQAALEATPTAFTASAAEERAMPVSWAADHIESPAKPDDFILGAFERGRLVGIAGLSRPELRQARHKATLFGMAVAADAWGRGIGRALVARLVEEAAALDGLLQIVLTVSGANDRAERLYRSCGFVEFGREPRAVLVDGKPVTKVHMIKTLDGFPVEPLGSWANNGQNGCG